MTMGTSVRVTGNAPILTKVATICKTMTRAVRMDNPAMRLVLTVVLFVILNYLLLLFQVQPGYSAIRIIQQYFKNTRALFYLAEKFFGPRKPNSPRPENQFSGIGCSTQRRPSLP